MRERREARGEARRVEARERGGGREGRRVSRCEGRVQPTQRSPACEARRRRQNLGEAGYGSDLDPHR